jgi:hypothetical protein
VTSSSVEDKTALLVAYCFVRGEKRLSSFLDAFSLGQAAWIRFFLHWQEGKVVLCASFLLSQFVQVHHSALPLI